MARKAVPLLFLLLPVGLFASVSLVAAQSLSPREQLQQGVAELQKKPDDQALREKIIKLALTLEPKPAIPEEANRPFVMAVTFQKEAKDAAGYEMAIKAYSEALLLAPWWPDAYWNLSVAQEAAGRYDDAMRNLKLYLLANPQAASEAKNRLYALEAKKELAASPAAQAAQVKKKEEEFIKRLDGARFVQIVTTPAIIWENTLTIRGNEVVVEAIMTYMSRIFQQDNPHARIGEVQGKSFRFSLNGREFYAHTFYMWVECTGVSCKGVISEDGSRITITRSTPYPYSGFVWPMVYLRKY